MSTCLRVCRWGLTDWSQVVDFSEAQRQGFCIAYADTFSGVKEGPRWQMEFEEGEVWAKGCGQHFCAKVTQIGRSLEFVPREGRASFRELASQMIGSETLEEFHRNVDAIKTNFPSLVKWVDWWARPEVARMIVPAFVQMSKEAFDALPWSTNAQEAMHNLMQNTVGLRHKSEAGAIDNFYIFANTLFTLQSLHRGEFFLAELRLKAPDVFQPGSQCGTVTRSPGRRLVKSSERPTRNGCRTTSRMCLARHG